MSSKRKSKRREREKERKERKGYGGGSGAGSVRASFAALCSPSEKRTKLIGENSRRVIVPPVDPLVLRISGFSSPAIRAENIV